MLRQDVADMQALQVTKTPGFFVNGEPLREFGEVQRPLATVVIGGILSSTALTLLSGPQKQDVALAPAGNALRAKGDFKLAAGTKVLASVKTASGAASTALFTLP